MTNVAVAVVFFLLMLVFAYLDEVRDLAEYRGNLRGLCLACAVLGVGEIIVAIYHIL